MIKIINLHRKYDPVIHTNSSMINLHFRSQALNVSNVISVNYVSNLPYLQFCVVNLVSTISPINYTV